MNNDLRLSALTRALDYATEGCSCDPDVAVNGLIVEVDHEPDCTRAMHGLGIVALPGPTG